MAKEKLKLARNKIRAWNSDTANSRKGDASSEPIKTWPTKESPRECLLAEGPEKLTDAELLTIILRVGSGTFRKRGSVMTKEDKQIIKDK